MKGFKEDKKIDPNNLDLEAVQHPEKFFKWAKKAIDAKAEVSRVQLRLEVLEAELKLKIQDNPEEFGLAKVTIPAIDAALKKNEKFITAKKDLIEAMRVSQMLDKAVVTMEHKKRMIEVLITLHGQSYFAGPSVPHDLGATYLEMQKKKEDRLNKVKARKRGRKKDD